MGNEKFRALTKKHWTLFFKSCLPEQEDPTAWMEAKKLTLMDQCCCLLQAAITHPTICIVHDRSAHRISCSRKSDCQWLTASSR